MQKAYNRTAWENYPSDKSPVNKTNLNHIEAGIDEIDNRVITLDTTKFDKSEAQGFFKDVSLNRSNGVITFTMYSGATKTIDTLLEKIAVNFDYDPVAQRLVITLDDGTAKYIDLSALITQYEFLDSDTAAFSVNSEGKVTVIVKEGSIGEKHMRPDYLADIRLEVAKAQASQQAAAASETNAKASETAAKQSEVNAKESGDAAKVSETNAKTSETNAASSASTASANAAQAGISASAAAESEENAAISESNADSSAATAANKANAASQSADTAIQKATEASDYATGAESYAHGGTGTRQNEDIDNAKYYYEQSRSISESFTGALRPMGTVTFANLPALTSAVEGDMYNVSDQFTTTASFKEGSGNIIPAGANIYKTADGYWDVLAGSPVTGVKGNAENIYHRGNVNLTPANLGITVVNNTADADKSVNYAASAGNAASATKATKDANGNNIADTYQKKTGDTADNTVSFTSGDSANPTWTTVPLLSSGEKHSSIMNKISTMFKNVRYLSNLLGRTDISAIGGGTVTGAVSAVNAKFASYLPISKHGALYTCDMSGLWSTVTVGSTKFITYITGCCNFLSDKKCDIHMDIMLRDNFGNTGSPHNTMMVNMDNLKTALSMSSLTFVTNQTEARLILPWNWTSTYGINDTAIAFSCYENDMGSFRFTNDGRITRRFYDTDGQIKWGNLLLNTNQLDCRKGAIWRVDIYGASYT